MWTNKLLATATGLVMLFSSCQKDVIKEEAQSLSSEAVASNATAADNTIETAPPVYTNVVANVNGNVANFWQAVPALYNQTTKTYPLILFIHGIGELGTAKTMNCCGLPRHLNLKTFPANFNIGGVNRSFIVMAPQFKVRPSAADMQSVIDYAKKRFRIDASRIYVTGLSMGGGSTWDYSGVFGQNAAAIVPVCGGTSPNTTLCTNIASKNLPYWGIYSSKDAVVPSSWGTTFFNTINKLNSAYASKTKLTIWTDVDHNGTWGRAFDPKTKVDGYNIYEWMLLYSRSGTTSTIPTSPAPPTTGNVAPLAKAGADQSVPSSWNWFPNLNANASSDSDGWISKFTWTQISGPNTAKLGNPNAGNTPVTGWTTGTYVFRVAVQDNDGAISYDDISITITSGTTTTPTTTTTPPATNPTAGNIPAIAKAGADRSVPASWKWFPNLNAHASTDSDGWINKFVWSQVSGPNTVKIGNPNTGNTPVTGWTTGTYVFRVAVYDNDGAISYDDIKITVTNN